MRHEANTSIRPEPEDAFLPYARQSLSEDDITAVVDVLRSDWLTTGPTVSRFEREFAAFVGAGQAVAVSSGTAALHAAMSALDVSPGDEVIVPAMTFAATANAVVYQGGVPVFADVDPSTLLIDPADVERKLSRRTRAIVAVDYAGQPCPYARLRELAGSLQISLVADAAHSLGAEQEGRRCGTLADLSTFSFHPVKPMTTGEGGMITTDDPRLAERMRCFRNHGIDTDHRQRSEQGAWFYRMTELGYNYRLSDIQCALGRSQLVRVPGWVDRRRQLAARYDMALSRVAGIEPLQVSPDVRHAYHLYVVRVDADRAGLTRDELFTAFRVAGIGANVHYVPVHLHPFYRERFGTGPGLCPVAEAAFRQILTLPLFAAMTDGDVTRVVAVMENAVCPQVTP